MSAFVGITIYIYTFVWLSGLICVFRCVEHLPKSLCLIHLDMYTYTFIDLTTDMHITYKHMKTYIYMHPYIPIYSMTTTSTHHDIDPPLLQISVSIYLP